MSFPVMLKTYLPLILVLLLGLALRANGLRWGLPSDAFPFSPLHPDERFVMDTLQQMNWSQGDFNPDHLLKGVHDEAFVRDTLQQMNWSQGDFNPDQAHREGTLAYYIWSGVGYLLQTLGVIPQMPWETNGFNTGYGAFIFGMRVVNVLLDTVGILLVYIIVLGLVPSNLAATLSALLFALTPFELIYAHYARTHSLSNFFLLLVFAASIPLRKTPSPGRTSFVGILCGMAAASRYPTAAAAIVPIMILLLHYGKLYIVGRSQPGNAASCLRSLSLRYALLGASALLAFFICDPYLFLDFETARKHLTEQASFIDSSQFGWASLFDSTKLNAYLTYLFPYGTLPFLWVLFYAGVLFTLVWPPLYSATMPFLAFLFIYFVAMAKGYTTELVFVRAMMGLFPVCCVLSGISLWCAWGFAKRHRITSFVSFGSLSGILLSTLAYDLAYTNAMNREDPRVALANYIRDHNSKAEIRIGSFPYVRNFIAMDPPLEAMAEKRIATERREDLLTTPGDVDYVVLPAFEPFQFAQAAQRAEEFAASEDYRLVGSFHNPIAILGYEFSNRNNPHDLQYPFPDLYLLERVRE